MACQQRQPRDMPDIFLRRGRGVLPIRQCNEHRSDQTCQSGVAGKRAGSEIVRPCAEQDIVRERYLQRSEMKTVAAFRCPHERLIGMADCKVALADAVNPATSDIHVARSADLIPDAEAVAGHACDVRLGAADAIHRRHPAVVE